MGLGEVRCWLVSENVNVRKKGKIMKVVIRVVLGRVIS